MFNNLRLRLFRSAFTDSIDCYLVERTHDGRMAQAKPVEMEIIESNVAPHTPTFRLEQVNAQALMDELWNCGIRPTEGTGSAGALAATQNHLKDMQGVSDRLLKMIEQARVIR
jgi:hypothetical protein